MARALPSALEKRESLLQTMHLKAEGPGFEYFLASTWALPV